MKECRDCKYFEGYDYSDGTPYCKYEKGYENCPYNDETEIKNNGIKIEVDAGFMHDYIYHTLKNTIEKEASGMAQEEIKSIITDNLKDEILEEMKRQIKETVSESISNFMMKEITIGGGWNNPERKVTREEYLSEVIENELKDRFKSDVLRNSIINEIAKSIDNYDRKLRDEINKGVKNYFDVATRQTLTENVVSMLMTNDTYQKLSNSMKTFLP
jgi:hypothetical protein